MSDEITPANVDENTEINTEGSSRGHTGYFNCRGVVRIDFIYNATEGSPYMLEINTVPGQSEASIVPNR
jgi:D-alanine-D-alanine ligase